MKKQHIIYLILLAIPTNIIFGQRISITNDSLRNRFKKETAVEVLIYFTKNSNWVLDWENLYYDRILKDSLLRWLDDDVIIGYELHKSIERFEENFEYDKEQKASFTKRYVEKILKLKFDSICVDTETLNIYAQKAILEVVNNDIREELLKNKKELLPPFQVLVFHSRIVYPEAYKKIKYWWYLNNKDEKNLYYLLRMNDPEAKNILDKRLKEFIQSKDRLHPYYLSMPKLETIGNAYAVKKLIELLPVKRSVMLISEDPPVPHDDIILYEIIMLCTRNDIKLPEIDYEGGEGTTEYVRKHRDDIINAAYRLIEKLEKEEQYWMENMPFDYVPQIGVFVRH